MQHRTHLFRYVSPLGNIGLELVDGICQRVLLGDVDAPESPPDHAIVLWLHAYFRGERLPLPDIAPASTAFQARLRQQLLKIPFGKVSTYGELARVLRSSPRAIGQALGRNPLPILVPCHRIVAANGLGGFSCGLAWKKRLLHWEGSVLV